jgi:hypothetical protein
MSFVYVTAELQNSAIIEISLTVEIMSTNLGS